jgi:rhodanese-related sulfurtransferase
MTASITPHRLAALHRVNQSIDLIDVRTPAEYREAHIDFARNVPLDRLDPSAVFTARGGRTEEPVYLICRTGGRASQACQKLLAAGLNAVNVEGGTEAWDAAGLPVVRGRKAISLERQTRIVIGIIVLASALLAAVVHPYWIGLTAFMGAGLIFSGVTDFCGLALILGRMPWNQADGGSAESTGDQASNCCSIRKA